MGYERFRFFLLLLQFSGTFYESFRCLLKDPKKQLIILSGVDFAFAKPVRKLNLSLQKSAGAYFC